MKRSCFKCKFLLLLTFVALMSWHCSSREEEQPPVTTYPTENPLQKFYQSAGLSIESISVLTPHEFGLTFSPQVKGRITAFTVRLPLDGPVTVTLWDYSTKNKITSATVDVKHGEVTRKEVTPVPLTANTRYVLSVNSERWYSRTKAGGSNVSYPVTVGNFIYHGYAYNSGSTQTFPATASVSGVGGDVSFEFQQTD